MIIRKDIKLLSTMLWKSFQLFRASGKMLRPEKILKKFRGLGQARRADQARRFEDVYGVRQAEFWVLLLI